MLQPLKYVIIDDDEIDRLAVETQASRYPFLHRLGICSQPIEALELITRYQPEIVFADIEMPELSGLELVTLLGGKVPAPVFITSHPEYAIEGYERHAFDYLLKPLSPERFDQCAARLRDFFQLRAKAFAFDRQSADDTLLIKQGYERYKLYLPDVLYLEAMKDYTRIVTRQSPYLVLNTLSGMMEQLPADRFIRIHRSFIVNRDRIDALKGNKVILQTHELPVGKIYRQALNGILQ
ncbi:LytTR family DNA-binding domain-containing protein [Puia sp.]|uniref:LytR/AlgR family response regulator transcription factor n=1 Tax=Puia sp. TaxID=2045100 RepID=UPI002F42E90B